jgi:hypothetical protein
MIEHLKASLEAQAQSGSLGAERRMERIVIVGELEPTAITKASMEARFKEPRLLPAAYLSTTGRSQGIGESTTTQRKHGPSEGQESPAWDRVDHVVCPTDFCFSL